jgi:hypothetical protein
MNYKTKHTNGPWYVDGNVPHHGLHVVTKNNECLATIQCGDNDPIFAKAYVETSRANARLMAAAPDLLTAVQQLVATLHNTYYVFEDLCKTGNMSANPLDNHVVQDIADQAADALEQATGVKP